MVWALSPLLGFFLSPILGSVSDRCTSRFGRRRPIIVLLSIGLICGLILAPWGRDLGRLFGDLGHHNVTVANLTNDDPDNFEYKTVNVPDNSKHFYYAILFTVLGTLLLDFNADNCQTPSRAYLLDVCVPEEHAHALATFTIMAGVGGCLGYALGAINWDVTIFSDLIGDNIKTVFTIVTLLFALAMSITITSFRELPLKLMQSDEMLRPVTQVAVKKEKERLKALENSDKPPTTSAVYISEKPGQEISKSENELRPTYGSASHDSNISVSSSSDDEEDEADESITLMMYLKSIIFMPKSLRILCITNCLSWMGHILYCLYFTDFVGETVFGGDPAAPMDSVEYDVRFYRIFSFLVDLHDCFHFFILDDSQLYDQGIRFGCWGMALYAFSCSIFSFIIEKMIKKFTAKFVFVGAMLGFSLAMAILGETLKCCLKIFKIGLFVNDVILYFILAKKLYKINFSMTTFAIIYEQIQPMKTSNITHFLSIQPIIQQSLVSSYSQQQLAWFTQRFLRFLFYLSLSTMARELSRLRNLKTTTTMIKKKKHQRLNSSVDLELIAVLSVR